MTATSSAELATPWPLAGTPEFERADPAWRQALIERITHDLRRHVMDAWFPRSIDQQAGGFWATFDIAWRRRGDGHRMLEFQARQTRTAARLGVAFPAQAERWSAIALHGFEQLRGMADSEAGGWFWIVERDGRPLFGATKHAHGISYLLSACVEVFRLTGDTRAMTMAEEIVDWLEAVHHDDEHGGYHGWVTRDGRPILAADDVPRGADREPLDHGIGLKDVNVVGDILDAYRALASLQASERVLARMDELYRVICQRFITPAGAIHYMTHADWTPVPTLERYGYLVQHAYRMPAAAALLGNREAALPLAELLTRHALQRGWDDRASAIVLAGAAAEPDALGSRTLRIPDVEWWTQAEALRALVLLAVNDPASERWRTRLDQLLVGIQRGFIDHRHGGWHFRPLAQTAWRRRLRGDPPKGTDWKDASHEADAYLSVLRMLRGLPDEAPLGS